MKIKNTAGNCCRSGVSIQVPGALVALYGSELKDSPPTSPANCPNLICKLQPSRSDVTYQSHARPQFCTSVLRLDVGFIRDAPAQKTRQGCCKKPDSKIRPAWSDGESKGFTVLWVSFTSPMVSHRKKRKGYEPNTSNNQSSKARRIDNTNRSTEALWLFQISGQDYGD